MCRSRNWRSRKCHVAEKQLDIKIPLVRRLLSDCFQLCNCWLATTVILIEFLCVSQTSSFGSCISSVRCQPQDTNYHLLQQALQQADEYNAVCSSTSITSGIVSFLRCSSLHPCSILFMYLVNWLCQCILAYKLANIHNNVLKLYIRKVMKYFPSINNVHTVVRCC